MCAKSVNIKCGAKARQTTSSLRCNMLFRDYIGTYMSHMRAFFRDGWLREAARDDGRVCRCKTEKDAPRKNK